MSIWAIADLHLSFGVPDKAMDVFGEQWVNHAQKIENHWKKLISPDDLVLIPGDISWAMRTEDARPDLEWVDQLPGTKVILRGNHDYWWTSLSKVEKILPPSVNLLQNNVFKWKNVSIAGARLWDTAEYSFHPYIDYVPNTRAKSWEEGHQDQEEAEKVFQRELLRLEMSLKGLPNDSSVRLAMTHYPPIGADLKPSRTSMLLEKYKIKVCVFGHLHNIKQDVLLFGTKNDVRYLLTSCDYLNFCPMKIND